MALKDYIATLEGVKKASEGKQDKLNTTQEAAVNSGITADKIATYSAHVTNNDIHVTSEDKQLWSDKQNALTSAQIDATNSGIDSTKVGLYSSHIVNEDVHVNATEKSTWSGKQDPLTDDQKDAVNSGINSTKVEEYTSHINDTDIHVSEAQKIEWSAKQAALTTEQLAAVNSGITDTKVSTYDGYATTIAGKQDTLTTAQQSAVDSGADTTKINQIATNTTNIATLTSQVSGLTSVVSIKVEATLPATPTKNTLYFIGTAAPYHKYLVTSDGIVEDLGEGEVDLSQYYKKTETNTLLDKKLNLDGGTMTGTIILDSSIKNASIRSNVNDGCISLFGGTSNTTGANLWLGGQSWAGSGNFGGFALNAQDLSKRREFIGKTDGTLTWDNNTIYHAGNLLANPSGTGTTDLTKLQIGSTIYTIPTGSGYLPLAGGTMTGPITFDSATHYIMKCGSDSSWWGIFAGTDTDSSGMFLNGKNTSGSNPGTFAIKTAKTSSYAARYLMGYPNGNLTWDDKLIYNAGNLIPNPSGTGTTSLSKLQIGSTIYNIAGGAGDYLPLAGGTMTGGIVFNSTATNPLFITRGIDTDGIRINGGSANEHGARLAMMGKNASAYKGAWFLEAHDGTNMKRLIGYPDGTLIWNDKNVITAAGGTISGALTLGAETILTEGNITCQSKKFILKHNNDADYTGIYGGSYLNNGASIAIGGASNSIVPGQILLRVCTNASDMKILALKPDGTITWNDKAVYHAGNLLANPTGTGTTDLTKLQIGSIVYNLATSENLKTINGISLKGTGDIEVVPSGTIVTMPVGAYYETETDGTPGMTGTWEQLPDRNEWNEVEQNITPGGGTGLIKAHLCRDGLVRIYLVDAASGDGKVINPMPADFVPELDTVVAAAYTESAPAQLFFSKSANIVYTTVGVNVRGEMFYKSGKTPDRVIHRWKRTA